MQVWHARMSLLAALVSATTTLLLLVFNLDKNLGGYGWKDIRAYHPVFMTLAFCFFMVRFSVLSSRSAALLTVATMVVALGHCGLLLRRVGLQAGPAHAAHWPADDGCHALCVWLPHNVCVGRGRA